MIIKTITYTDYNGVERTEEFYFNISRAELLKMETGVPGGLGEKLKRIVAAQDVTAIMNEFESIILSSYGEKSPDGKHFIKDENLTKAFQQTEAYSELLMELCTDDVKAAEFVNGIMPKMPNTSSNAVVVK